MRAAINHSFEGGHALNWLEAGAAAVAAVAGAFGLWLANRLLGRAAFQTAINNGFKELTDQLQEERRTLQDELAAERIAGAKDRARFNNEIANLTSAVDALERLLRKHGIEVPERRPFVFDPDSETPPMLTLPPKEAS